MRNALMAVVLVLVASPLLAQPTTAPTTEPSGPARRGPMAVQGRGRGFIPPEQQQALLEWANANMPNVATLARQARGGRGRQNILALIRVRMQVATDPQVDPIVKERMHRNMVTENQIAQYVLDLDDATNAAERTQIQDRIRAAMRQNVQSFLNERQERIDRLRTRLEAEQKSLDDDRENVDLLVARRLGPLVGPYQGMELPAPAAEPTNAAPAQVPEP